MKIVFILSAKAKFGCLMVHIPEQDVQALVELCGKAGHRVVALVDEKRMYNKDYSLNREEIPHVS